MFPETAHQDSAELALTEGYVSSNASARPQEKKHWHNSSRTGTTAWLVIDLERAAGAACLSLGGWHPQLCEISDLKLQIVTQRRRYSHLGRTRQVDTCSTNLHRLLARSAIWNHGSFPGEGFLRLEDPLAFQLVHSEGCSHQ